MTPRQLCACRLRISIASCCTEQRVAVLPDAGAASAHSRELERAAILHGAAAAGLPRLLRSEKVDERDAAVHVARREGQRRKAERLPLGLAPAAELAREGTQELRGSLHVQLLEVEDLRSHIYLILEYCGGGDLRSCIRKQPRPAVGHPRLDEAVSQHFMRDLASGLQFLWQNNYIHRDLKPGKNGL